MNTDPIKRFLNRIKTASQAKVEEVRIPITEANELSIAIAEILSDALKRGKTVEPTTVMEIKLDGGSFKQ